MTLGVYSVVTFRDQKARDQVYRLAGTVSDAYVSVAVLLVIISMFIAVLLASAGLLAASTFITATQSIAASPSVAPEVKSVISAAAMMVALVATYFILRASLLIARTQFVRMEWQYRMDAAAPDLTEADERLFRAGFALMKGEADFAELKIRLRKTVIANARPPSTLT